MVRLTETASGVVKLMDVIRNSYRACRTTFLFLILGSWLSPGLTTAFPPAPNWGPKGWGVDDPDSTTAERPVAAFPFTGSARPCREPHQAAPLIEQIAS